MIFSETIDMEHIDELIKSHMAFIIRTTSNFTGRYITIENDDEFSIALLAFKESVEKYDQEKGNFLSFAKLVIESRLLNFTQLKQNQNKAISLDELYEQGIEFSQNHSSTSIDLQEEIELFCKELKIFGLTLEKLADAAPKHKDTKERAIDIAEVASDNHEVVTEMYHKRKLPVRHVAKISNVSEKIIKHSKVFILGTMILFIKEFKQLLQWIMKSRCNHHVS